MASDDGHRDTHHLSASDPFPLAKGHCPECGPNRNADVVGHYQMRDHDEEHLVWAKTDYRILRCRGCGAVYFQTDYIYSEDVEFSINPHTGEHEATIPNKVTHWPAPSKRKQPDWAGGLFIVDNDLHSLFDDIYVALNSDLRALSAIGIRTAFDRASELLGVNPAKNFAEKLTELVQIGKIGESERDTLNILIDAGSAAAHRGWKPEPRELDAMMSIIEAFLYRAFILDAEAKSLKQKVPAKQIQKNP